MTSLGHTIPDNNRRDNAIRNLDLLSSIMHINRKKSKNMTDRVRHQAFTLNASVEAPSCQKNEIDAKEVFALEMGEEHIEEESEVRELTRTDQATSECPSEGSSSRCVPSSGYCSPDVHHQYTSEAYMPMGSPGSVAPTLASTSGRASRSDMALITPCEASDSIDVAVESLVTLADTYTVTGRNDDAVRVMERAVFYQEKHLHSGLHSRSSLVPLLTKLAECQQTCGSLFEAKCTRDYVRYICDEEVIEGRK